MFDLFWPFLFFAALGTAALATIIDSLEHGDPLPQTPCSTQGVFDCLGDQTLPALEVDCGFCSGDTIVGSSGSPAAAATAPSAPIHGWRYSTFTSVPPRPSPFSNPTPALQQQLQSSGINLQPNTTTTASQHNRQQPAPAAAMPPGPSHIPHTWHPGVPSFGTLTTTSHPMHAPSQQQQQVQHYYQQQQQQQGGPFSQAHYQYHAAISQGDLASMQQPPLLYPPDMNGFGGGGQSHSPLLPIRYPGMSASQLSRLQSQPLMTGPRRSDGAQYTSTTVVPSAHPHQRWGASDDAGPSGYGASTLAAAGSAPPFFLPEWGVGMFGQAVMQQAAGGAGAAGGQMFNMPHPFLHDGMPHHEMGPGMSFGAHPSMLQHQSALVQQQQQQQQRHHHQQQGSLMPASQHPHATPQEQQHSSAQEQHSMTDLKLTAKIQRSQTGPCKGSVSDSEESVQMLRNSGPLPILGVTAAADGSNGGGNGAGSSSGGGGSGGTGNNSGGGGGSPGGGGTVGQLVSTSGSLPSPSDGKRRSTRAGVVEPSRMELVKELLKAKPGGSGSGAASSSRASGESKTGDPLRLLGDIPEELVPQIIDKAARRGKGGRQPAGDPRLDPDIDPKRAKRILSNRLSAARSKMKAKIMMETMRTKQEMMAAQRKTGAAEVEQLRRMCSDLQNRNLQLQAQLHVSPGQQPSTSSLDLGEEDEPMDSLGVQAGPMQAAHPQNGAHNGHQQSGHVQLKIEPSDMEPSGIAAEPMGIAIDPRPPIDDDDSEGLLPQQEAQYKQQQLGHQQQQQRQQDEATRQEWMAMRAAFDTIIGPESPCDDHGL